MASSFRLTYLLGGRLLKKGGLSMEIIEEGGLKGRRIETIMPEIVDP